MKARSQARGAGREDTSKKLRPKTTVSTSGIRPTPFTTRYPASVTGLWRSVKRKSSSQLRGVARLPIFWGG